MERYYSLALRARSVDLFLVPANLQILTNVLVDTLLGVLRDQPPLAPLSLLLLRLTIPSRRGILQIELESLYITLELYIDANAALIHHSENHASLLIVQYSRKTDSY